MTAPVDFPPTTSAKRSVAVGAVVVVLTPALGAAAALAALPLFAVAGLLVAASLGGGSLLARTTGSDGRRPLPETRRVERDEPRERTEARAEDRSAAAAAKAVAA